MKAHETAALLRARLRRPDNNGTRRTVAAVIPDDNIVEATTTTTTTTTASYRGLGGGLGAGGGGLAAGGGGLGTGVHGGFSRHHRYDDDGLDDDGLDDGISSGHASRTAAIIEEYDSGADDDDGGGGGGKRATRRPTLRCDTARGAATRRASLAAADRLAAARGRGDHNDDAGLEMATWQEERRVAALAGVGDGVVEKIEARSVARTYARVLAEPRTNEDEDYQIEHDDDALRWRPCEHPRYAALLSELGEPQPRTECWGCQHGNKAFASVSAKRLDEMQALYVENRHEVDLAVLARTIERFYEKHVRTPTNDLITRQRGQERGIELLPEWRAATILDHFTNHRSEPAAKLSKRLDQVSAIADHLFSRGVFRAPANAPDAELRPGDVRISEKHARLYMQTLAMEQRLYAAVPARMHGYNADAAALGQVRAQPFVRARHNAVDVQRQIKPAFDAAPPQPL